MRSCLVAQSIPIRRQATGQDFCVVLCGIWCPVNLHQLRPAILKMSSQILPPPPQAPRCSSCNSICLPMPMPHALPVITKMQNETVLAFWHSTFWYTKMSNCFTGLTFHVYTDIDRLWLPWFWRCSILTECVTSWLTFKEWNRLIECNLDWLDNFRCSVNSTSQRKMSISIQRVKVHFLEFNLLSCYWP